MLIDSRRLTHGGQIDRNRPLKFQFNGRELSGYHGDSVASALMANGIDVLSRSFKYHRPRGVQNRGYADVTSLVQLCDKHESPNILASAQPLYEGLVANSVNCWPNVNFDLWSMLSLGSAMLPSGFYYKTFMWPNWHAFEPVIRRAAGFGTAPKEIPQGRYSSRFAHCDILVIGSGPAGLMAALTAARAGARTVLVDEMADPGGALRYENVTIDGEPAAAWVKQVVNELEHHLQVNCLWNATAWGYQEGNMVCVAERDPKPSELVGRNWKIWAKQVILATGAIERPIVFENNDVPGVMQCSAVMDAIGVTAVAPGKKALIFTNNDGAYELIPHLDAAGIEMVGLVDTRTQDRIHQATLDSAANVELIPGMSVQKVVRARNRVRGVIVGPRAGQPAQQRMIECDLVCVSGGWNPCVHLFSQARGSLRYDDDIATFVPHRAIQPAHSAGAANGMMTLSACLADGVRVADKALSEIGFRSQAQPSWNLSGQGIAAYRIEPYWSSTTGDRRAKAFVDMAGDVTVFDLRLALREGFAEVEHLKRYTTNGMGLDQGKTANVNAIGIVAEHLNCHPAEVGTTTFRPPYTPVEFGAIAGSQSGAVVLPYRHTPMTGWNKVQGAVMYEAGARWRRPGYYPQPGEIMDDAIVRECHAVRNGVGVYDGSPLGKFMIQGVDALQAINLLYTNSFDSLKPGQGRYGVMLNEEGLIFDDGVTFRLDEHRYLLSCSTGGTPAVERKLDKLINVECPELEVLITPMTSQWANATVCGPLARQLLEAADSDLDWSVAALPFMHMQQGTIAGLPARVFRVSFTGELSFEINVPSRYGLQLWEYLIDIGQRWDICPVGSEANHVLRVEKGFLSLAHEVDGTVDPIDLGLGWIVSRKKADFIGKRAMEIRRANQLVRQELVGLLPEDSAGLIPEGAPIAPGRGQVQSEGFVSACVWSSSCDRTIALGLLNNGRARIGETVLAWNREKSIPAVVTRPVFYDPQGERLRM